MKVFGATLAAFLVASCDGFVTPNNKIQISSSTFGVRQLNTCEGPSASCLNAEKPFFASEETTTSAEVTDEQLDELSAEEEVELLVKEEIKKTKKASKFRTTNGVEFAPWMKVSAEDEAKMRQIASEKTAARRKRQAQEKDVRGNLLRDSQAQELSGTGLNYKVIDGQIELEWATKSETNTKGFIVKRRRAKTEDFETIASFEEWGPLASKGADGGIYRYLDTVVTPGGWVYRITEMDNNGNESDICQCLVELQTDEEQRGAVVALAGFAAVAVLATVAGLAFDPLQ
jgi:hypothetical protein